MDFIPVNSPYINPEAKRYLDECIETGWISSEGPFVPQFEQAMAEQMGRQYGVAVSSGTTGLQVAVDALGIGVGDEVIMPTLTIIACAAAIVRAGATPVLVDSDPDTWNMDVRQIEKKITSKTKAIMPVHLYGLPVDLDPVLELARVYDLKIIEDAAQAIGQTYKGEPCGSFGDVSVLSFYPNKHVTTGEGGMILTDDTILLERCRSFRDQCFLTEKRFYHEGLGWNARMTNLQAGLGLAQLKILDDMMLRKQSMAEHYTHKFRRFDMLQLPLPETPYAKNCYWAYGIVLRKNDPYDTSDILEQLSSLGIGTRPFFWPMHQQPVFHKMGLFQDAVSYPVSEFLSRSGFYIPSGLGLTPRDIKTVADRFCQVFEKALV